MKWMKARKKPKSVEFREVSPVGIFDGYGITTPAKRGESVITLHGPTIAIAGEDYIIRGPSGECWPIRKDVFRDTYDVTMTFCRKCGREIDVEKYRRGWNAVYCPSCGLIQMPEGM